MNGSNQDAINEIVLALVKQVEVLEAENRRLQERVSSLESRQQCADDERGYAEQGSRYSGKHPRSCACNRCLFHGR